MLGYIDRPIFSSKMLGDFTCRTFDLKLGVRFGQTQYKKQKLSPIEMNNGSTEISAWVDAEVISLLMETDSI